jgi:hypothetical protein
VQPPLPHNWRELVDGSKPKFEVPPEELSFKPTAPTPPEQLPRISSSSAQDLSPPTSAFHPEFQLKGLLDKDTGNRPVQEQKEREILAAFKEAAETVNSSNAVEFYDNISKVWTGAIVCDGKLAGKSQLVGIEDALNSTPRWSFDYIGELDKMRQSLKTRFPIIEQTLRERSAEANRRRESEARLESSTPSYSSGSTLLGHGGASAYINQGGALPPQPPPQPPPQRQQGFTPSVSSVTPQIKPCGTAGDLQDGIAGQGIGREGSG